MVFRLKPLLFLLAAVPQAATACGVLGDTVQVRAAEAGGEILLGDGRRVRFGGLAPDRASEAALAGWAGKRVGVALLGPKPDRWGRWIVDLMDETGKSLALDLLERGLARVRPEPEAKDCEADRLDAEAGARAAREGVWAEPGAVLDAADLPALSQADGRFVLVSGVVRRVGVGRAKVYLDFAGRDGFAVVVAAKSEPQFRRAGLDLKALQGERVLVRGVMDVRFGPRIEIADPAMIEPLEKVTGRGG